MAMSGNDGLSLADVAAVAGNNDGLFGGNGSTMALLILFLFAIMSGNWGGFGGGNAAVPYMVNAGVGSEVQRGFDQNAIMSGLGGLTATVANGFADAEVSRANSMTTLLQTINNLSMFQQTSCCETRAAISDLKYTVATEACADRAAVTSGVRDIQEALTAGFQTILTQMCNDKIDAKNEKIADLQTQLNMASLRESQTAQTAAILANNAAQTAALEQYLNPVPIPSYTVANPNCCGQTYACGCAA